MLGERAEAVRARFEAYTGYRRTRAPEWLLTVLAPLAGLAVLVALWALIAKQGGRIPDPITVAHAAAKIFADPFYSKGPNDQGIGWNVLSSLKRVGIGFGMAALAGIPLGFGIGFWVWDEWNNLKVEHIIIAIFTIGIVGLVLEQALVLLARRFSYA